MATRKPGFKWLLLILLLIAAVGGYVLFHKKTQAPAQAARPVEVVTGDLQQVVTAQGTIEQKNYVDVGAQVSGLIKKMHVEIGDTVSTGDLIAEIDPDVYESRVQADEAALKTLQAKRAEQEALVKQAQWKYDRNKSLFDDKAVSKEIYQDAEIALDVANANLMALDAQIEQAQSTLDGDQANLGYTKIYAPMDGTVVSQAVQEGQTINANQTAPVIVQVADLNTMTVKAQVAEADVMKLKVGMQMYFTTLGSGERRWNGVVRQILPSPQTINDVVLYNVLVDVENKDRSLMTGMTAQMFFIVAAAKNVPLIPASALGRRVPSADTQAGQAYEVSVATRGKPEKRTVIISLSDRTQAAVADGLKAGDKVLENGVAEKPAYQRQRMPRL